jgi:ribosome biogenesis GTPase / thiamine phosphate phosphatase
MSFQSFSLHQLGWRFNHAQHLTLADFEAGYPARVIAVHRSGLSVLSSRGRGSLQWPHHLVDTDVAMGDWVMVEHDACRVVRVIERQSLITCVASHRRQPIAANIDTLFIVASCIDDFHSMRLKRYLALAMEAGVEPVVVNCDLNPDAHDHVARVRNVLPGMDVVSVNATDAASLTQLAPWLGAGQAVAIVGSSGVGNSTLAHGLMGEAAIHGGHAREMFPTASGAWIIDTTDAHELRMVNAEPAEIFGEFPATLDSRASDDALMSAVFGDS